MMSLFKKNYCFDFVRLFTYEIKNIYCKHNKSNKQDNDIKLNNE